MTVTSALIKGLIIWRMDEVTGNMSPLVWNLVLLISRRSSSRKYRKVRKQNSVGNNFPLLVIVLTSYISQNPLWQHWAGRGEVVGFTCDVGLNHMTFFFKGGWHENSNHLDRPLAAVWGMNPASSVVADGTRTKLTSQRTRQRWFL